MNCRDAENTLSAYLDGQLSEVERKPLEEHLEQCQSCRGCLEELTLIRDALRSLPEVEMPEGLHGRIMAAVRAHASEISETGKCALESQGGTANFAFDGSDAATDSPSRRKVGFFRGLVNRISGMSARQWIPLTAAAMVLVMLLSVSGTLFLTDGGFGLNKLAKMTEQTGSPDFAAPSAAPPGYDGSGSMKSASPSLAGEADDMGMLTAGNRTVSVSERKLIRRAQVAVEVSRGKVRETAQLAESIVATNFGYIEQSSLSGNADKEMTSYYMVARVPAEGVEKTVDELCELGRVTKEDSSIQDVTDQYVDLDARLRNKINQENRLLEIMGEAKTVGELLQVEGELSRVRGDIESMQAQMNNYDKLTSLASISFSAVEEGSQTKPPSPWSDVWRVFVQAWRNLLLFAAQVAPSLIVLGVFFLGGAWLMRRKAKRA